MVTKQRGAQRAGQRAAWSRGFVAGLGAGAIGAAAVYFMVLSPTQPGAPGMSSAVDVKDGGKISGPKPKFEFYTILPELEVPVPDQTPANPHQASIPPALQTPPTGAALPSTPAPGTAGAPTQALPAPQALAPSAPPPATTGGRYILQAGSSRNAAEAERLRATLALQGMVAQVQPVNINNETWHRIRVGPFASREQADAAQRQLHGAKINTMLLELRAP